MTPEERHLHICNLVGRGFSLAEARIKAGLDKFGNEIKKIVAEVKQEVKAPAPEAPAPEAPAPEAPADTTLL